MAATGDEQRHSLQGGNGFALVEAPAAIVDRPVLHILGLRNGGKTTIIKELGLLGNYVCVPYMAAWRDRRAGEAHALTPNVKIVTLEEISEQHIVYGYHEEDVVYAFAQSTFPQRSGIPIITTVGLRGIDALGRGTLPHLLNVHITVNRSSKDALEKRIIDRLILTQEFPVDFDVNDVNSCPPEYRARIDERLEYTLQRIEDFKQKGDFYDATFFNETAQPQDIRAWLYRERPEDTIPKDIALRINRLYRLWTSKRMPPHSNIANTHNSFITALLKHTVGSIDSLKPNTDLFQAGIRGKQRKRILKGYCRLKDINYKYINDTIKQTIVDAVEKSDDGRINVYLRPVDGTKSISAQEVQHSQGSCDFDTLAFLIYVIEQRFKVRPTFITEGDVIKGIRYGLTDELHHSLVKPKSFYEVTFHYR